MNAALRINTQPVVMPLKALIRTHQPPGAARPDTHTRTHSASAL